MCVCVCVRVRVYVRVRVCLLITILAGAVICRLLSRDTLGIGSTVSYSNTCAGKKLSAKHTVKLVTGCQPGKVSQLRLA